MQWEPSPKSLKVAVQKKTPATSHRQAHMLGQPPPLLLKISSLYPPTIICTVILPRTPGDRAGPPSARHCTNTRHLHSSSHALPPSHAAVGWWRQPGRPVPREIKISVRPF